MDVEHLSIEPSRVSVFLRTSAPEARCQACGRASSRVHSRYPHEVHDLLRHSVPVTLHLRVRRFFCNDPSCGRRIFFERLSDVAAHARKTNRLEQAPLAIIF